MNNIDESRFNEHYQQLLKCLKLQGKADNTIDSYSSRALCCLVHHFDCLPEEHHNVLITGPTGCAKRILVVRWQRKPADTARGLVQQSDKIADRFALTIYPYSFDYSSPTIRLNQNQTAI